MSDCIFCKIITGTIPAKKVLETESTLAIEDMTPQAPVHVLILPKRHISTLNDLNKETRASILPELYDFADQVAQKTGIQTRGYRTVINNLPEAGQSVFHLHMHLLGGAQLKGRFGT